MQPVNKLHSRTERITPDGKYLCVYCKERLPEYEFGRVRPTGALQSYCKVCQTTARHGLSRTEYFRMYSEQDGKCAICQEGYEKLSVDHDHGCCPTGRSCGKCIRKLLCSACNTGLGLFKDSPNTLIRAAEYLKELS